MRLGGGSDDSCTGTGPGPGPGQAVPDTFSRLAALMSTVVEPQRTNVAGVPVYWAEGVTGAPFIAGLVFRVGFSDETLRTRGLTHIVEHLALPAASASSVEFGGEVDDTTTVFWFSGERAEVLELLTETCRTLTNLPLRRLERERETLRAEAAQRSRGFSNHVLGLRFGAGGHGLGGYDEYALEWVGPEEVAGWAAERFTRGAAAVYMTGAPAEDVVVELLEGRRLTPPPTKTIPYLSFPSVYCYGEDGGIGIAYLSERTHAAMAAAWILERRMRERLRYRAGMSYEVTPWFEPLTADIGHRAFWTDCLDSNLDAVRSGILAALDELSTHGPTPHELANNQAELRRRTLDPWGLPGRLFWRAAAELMGHPVLSEEEELAARASLSPQDVAYSARRIHETLLLSIPQAATPPAGRFTVYPVDSPQVVTGRGFRRRGLPFRKRHNERELVLGAEGITLFGEDYVRTVLFEGCVMVLRTGAERGLWARDGFFVWVDPEIWRNGEEIVRAIDAHLGSDLVVDLDAERDLFDDPDLAAGAAAWEKGEADEAADHFRRGLERRPEDATAWAWLAAIELDRRRPTAAIEAAEVACSLEPHVSWAHSARAHALWQAERTDEAALAIREALALDPGDLRLLGDTAWFVAATAHEEEAGRVADRAVELFPEEAYGWFARGWVAQVFGRFAQGEAAMQRAVELEPAEALWHNNLGWIVLKAHRPDEALSHFERALELDGSNRAAAGNRAIALRALGRRADADRLRQATLTTYLADAEQVLRERSDDVDAVVERVRALWRLERSEDALAAARLASATHSDKRLWELLAMLEAELGDPVRAVEAATRAAQLFPEEMSSLVQLVETAAFAGQTGLASERARDALARNDADPRAWYAAAAAAYARGDLDAAVAQTSRLRAENWLDCCTNALHGLVCHRRGERLHAQQAVEQARVFEPACLMARRLEAALAG
jgi:tetratricopeptide (TPR) repeat protein